MCFCFNFKDLWLFVSDKKIKLLNISCYAGPDSLLLIIKTGQCNITSTTQRAECYKKYHIFIITLSLDSIKYRMYVIVRAIFTKYYIYLYQFLHYVLLIKSLLILSNFSVYSDGTSTSFKLSKPISSSVLQQTNTYFCYAKESNDETEIKPYSNIYFIRMSTTFSHANKQLLSFSHL